MIPDLYTRTYMYCLQVTPLTGVVTNSLKSRMTFIHIYIYIHTLCVVVFRMVSDLQKKIHQRKKNEVRNFFELVRLWSL